MRILVIEDERKVADFVNRGLRQAQHVVDVASSIAEAEDFIAVQHYVAGVFMKHDSVATLSQAIRQVMSGKVWLDQQYLRMILDALVNGTHGRRVRSQRLTERERCVLNYILESDSQIWTLQRVRYGSIGTREMAGPISTLRSLAFRHSALPGPRPAGFFTDQKWTISTSRC
jgi:CheY-like chemotaxis protein